MTIVLLALAAALLGALVRTRDRRHAVARAVRRSERERQWRALIGDGGADDGAR